MRPDGSNAAAVDTERYRPWIRQGIPLTGEHRDQVVGVLESARAALVDVELPSADDLRDYPSAQQALRLAWDGLFATLSSTVRGTGSDPDRYLDLLNEIKRVEQNLYAERLRQRDDAFARVREALAMLREPESTAALIDQAVVATCVLGFDRAILSRVEDSAWITEKVWIERDPKWGEEVLEVGRANPKVLDHTLVETEMVRRKVGIMVHDVQRRPAVHRPIAEVSLSQSYTAVPLITHSEVVGFLHADCYYQRRQVDDFDRRVLSMFAEGLGQALGRTSMMDRLSSIRIGFDQVAGALAAAKDDRVWLGGSAPRPVAPAFGGLGGQRGGFPGYDNSFPTAGGEGCTLTRREIEVLRLMAAGDTNGRIARRLVISEGTVKSHVKHILRKLGAANRAEAVSRWLGMERERDGSRNHGAFPRRDY